MGISCTSQLQFPWGKLPGNGQVFPEKIYCQLTRAVEGMMLTCEVVEPPTRSWPPQPADWVVTAAFKTPHVASGGTPRESSRWLCGC